MIVYRSFFEAIKGLPKNSQAEVWNAVFEYGLNFNEIKLTGLSNSIFTLIKPQLDANIKRYKNGTQPKVKQDISEDEATDKQTVSETEANVNDNVNGNENHNLNGNNNEKVFSETPVNGFHKVDQSAKEGTPPFNAVRAAWLDYHTLNNLPHPTVGTWTNQKYEQIASRLSQKLQLAGQSPTQDAVRELMFAMIDATLRHKFWKKSFSLATIEANFDEIFNTQKKKNDIFDTSHIG